MSDLLYAGQVADLIEAQGHNSVSFATFIISIPPDQGERWYRSTVLRWLGHQVK